MATKPPSPAAGSISAKRDWAQVDLTADDSPTLHTPSSHHPHPHPHHQFGDDASGGGGDAAARRGGAGSEPPKAPSSHDTITMVGTEVLPSHLRERVRVLKPPRMTTANMIPTPEKSGSVDGGDASGAASLPPPTSPPNHPSPSCVLYWCRNAMRACENPSLCVAVSAANAMALPLIVLVTVEVRMKKKKSLVLPPVRL